MRLAEASKRDLCGQCAGALGIRKGFCRHWRYDGAGRNGLGLASTSLVGELTPGGADPIAGGVGPTEDEEESLDWAAMEFGTD